MAYVGTGEDIQLGYTSHISYSAVSKHNLYSSSKNAFISGGVISHAGWGSSIISHLPMEYMVAHMQYNIHLNVARNFSIVAINWSQLLSLAITHVHKSHLVVTLRSQGTEMHACRYIQCSTITYTFHIQVHNPYQILHICATLCRFSFIYDCWREGLRNKSLLVQYLPLNFRWAIGDFSSLWVGSSSSLGLNNGYRSLSSEKYT